MWNCRMTRACAGGQESVLFGWGKNAPALALPQGVGFAVGPGTATRTVVMQVCQVHIAAVAMLRKVYAGRLAGECMTM